MVLSVEPVHTPIESLDVLTNGFTPSAQQLNIIGAEIKRLKPRDFYDEFSADVAHFAETNNVVFAHPNARELIEPEYIGFLLSLRRGNIALRKEKDSVQKQATQNRLLIGYILQRVYESEFQSPVPLFVNLNLEALLDQKVVLHRRKVSLQPLADSSYSGCVEKMLLDFLVHADGGVAIIPRIYDRVLAERSPPKPIARPKSRPKVMFDEAVPPYKTPKSESEIASRKVLAIPDFVPLDMGTECFFYGACNYFKKNRSTLSILGQKELAKVWDQDLVLYAGRLYDSAKGRSLQETLGDGYALTKESFQSDYVAMQGRLLIGEKLRQLGEEYAWDILRTLQSPNLPELITQSMKVRIATKSGAGKTEVNVSPFIELTHSGDVYGAMVDYITKPKYLGGLGAVNAAFQPNTINTIVMESVRHQKI